MRNLHLTFVCTVDKSKVEISQNFVAFSEYMNFIIIFSTLPTEKNRQKKLHNNNRPQASRLKQTRRLKFAIDQTLRLEYTVPLAKDFQVTLSGGGALIRHKVAFFAEDEAAAVVGLLDSRGVQVIRKRGGAERKRSSNFVS